MEILMRELLEKMVWQMVANIQAVVKRRFPRKFSTIVIESPVRRFYGGAPCHSQPLGSKKPKL